MLSAIGAATMASEFEPDSPATQATTWSNIASSVISEVAALTDPRPYRASATKLIGDVLALDSSRLIVLDHLQEAVEHPTNLADIMREAPL